MSEPMLTKQEMFDRAVRGLASQGFEQCTFLPGSNGYMNSSCAYSYTRDDGFIMHCAWGWVDPEGTVSLLAGVRTLRVNKCGLAAHLSEEDTDPQGFAARLQRAHDRSFGRDDMVNKLSSVACDFQLTWPADVSV